jgi:hypothetical protein
LKTHFLATTVARDLKLKTTSVEQFCLILISTKNKNMEPTSYSSSTPSNPASGIRNTFLTVICILSFLGSGWGIVKAVRSYVTADYTAQIGSEVIKNTEDRVNQRENVPGFVQRIMGSVEADMNPDFLRKLAIFSLISNLLTLTGAILMWNLKKIGFYIYILGIIVLIAAPLTMGKLVGAIGASIIGFIGVIFIVMYGVNLKQMESKA